MIRQKTWPHGARGLFSLYTYIENLKNLLVRNHWTDFNITWQECFLGNPLTILLSRHDSSKNMAARVWGFFSLYINIENFESLLVRNHWTNFNIIWQECSLVNLYQDCLSWLSWFVKKHGRYGLGLIFPLYLYRIKVKKACLWKQRTHKITKIGDYVV